MKVTTPIKTINDVISEGKISSDLLEHAVMQAYQKGLITRKQLDLNPQVVKYLKSK